MSDALGVRNRGTALARITVLTLLVSMSELGSLSFLNVLWERAEGLNIPQDLRGRIHLFIHTANIYTDKMTRVRVLGSRSRRVPLVCSVC